MADSLILMVMALVVFGPRRLPQIGRQIGKLMYEFRKASNDFKFQMEEELRMAEEADRRKKEEEERQRSLAANPPAQIEATTSVSTETPAETSATSESAYPYSSYSEAAEAQFKSEPATPTIQPPSTGETVAAEKPFAAAAETSESAVAPAAEPALAEESDLESPQESQTIQQAYAVPPAVEDHAPLNGQNDASQTAVEESEKNTEPATHNG